MIVREGTPILLTILSDSDPGWLLVVAGTALAFCGAILAAVLTARRGYSPPARADVPLQRPGSRAA